MCSGAFLERLKPGIPAIPGSHRLKVPRAEAITLHSLQSVLDAGPRGVWTLFQELNSNGTALTGWNILLVKSNIRLVMAFAGGVNVPMDAGRSLSAVAPAAGLKFPRPFKLEVSEILIWVGRRFIEEDAFWRWDDERARPSEGDLIGKMYGWAEENNLKRREQDIV
jgi:hypothetical protein